MTEDVAECAVACGNELGEAATWCTRRQCLYWTDIEAATLWCYTPAANTTRTWSLPERLACMALCKDPDWLLLGLASQLAFFHLPTGALEPIGAVEPDLPTRLNDGVCDRDGRFVFGTLHEPPAGEAQRPLGSFYRLDADLSLHRLALGRAAVPNSLAFSPDGRTLYCCDSPTRVIHRCAWNAEGDAGPLKVFVHLDDMPGVPDGATVDAAGGVWSAQWGMGRLVRYLPDGRQDRTITIPAARPTRPAFGGRLLDTLFVTSAREGADTQMLQADTGAGNLWRFRVDGITGLAEACFAGTPGGDTLRPPHSPNRTMTPHTPPDRFGSIA